MKDYVSPHARQKKKHMDMITGSLLNLHESYFSSSSPSSPSTNKVSSLASLLREGGGFHAPTSNVTPTALLSLTDTAPQALAKIFSETDPKAGGEIPSLDHLASYLGSLDYADFYKLFPALYDILTIPYHTTLDAAPPKRGSAASRNAPAPPPVDAPPEHSHPTQYRVHHLIHDYLLPLSNRLQIIASTTLALSSEVISHPLIVHGMAKWEPTLVPLFEHFASLKDICLKNPYTHKSTVHASTTIDREEYYKFLRTFFDSYPNDRIDEELLPLFDLTLSASSNFVPAPKRCSNNAASLPFMGFVEILVLTSLSLSPHNVPNSQIVPAVYATFTSLMERITKQQLIATVNHYSRPPTFPPLTRFLALLRDSGILNSRLGYHEAARIFIDASSPPDPVSPLPTFEQIILKTIPILAVLLPPSKSSDYVRTSLQNTFYRNHNPDTQSMSGPPPSFQLPMCDAQVLQHLAKAALSPLRYVFLRYGGYISDDVEACAPTIVTSSWQTAIEKKDDLTISQTAFLDFLSHFNVMGNTNSHLSLRSVNKVVQLVCSANSTKDITFASFLDSITVIAITYFSGGLPDATAVSCISSLFSIMDPAEIMFLSPAPASNNNKNGTPSSPNDDSTIGSNDPYNIASGPISPGRSPFEPDAKSKPSASNPFDTPFCEDDDIKAVPSTLVADPAAFNNILFPPPKEKQRGPARPRPADPKAAMEAFEVKLPLRNALFQLYQTLSLKEPQPELQAGFSTSVHNNSNNEGRVKGASKGGRVVDGVSVMSLLSFCHVSKILTSTRIAPKKLQLAILLAESWQRLLDAEDGPDSRNKVSTYHQPTKSANHRSSSVVGSNKTRKRKSLLVLQEECLPNGFESPPDAVKLSSAESLFHSSILSALGELSSKVVLSFSTGLSCDEVKDPPTLRSPILRSTTLDSVDCKLPGNIAVALLDIVKLSPPTPFDVMAAFFSVLGTSESEVLAKFGGISYSNFHLSLLEYGLFIAKVSMIVCNGSTSKTIKLLEVTLNALEDFCSKTQINDTALTLLVDDHAPIAALGGQDDELQYLYLHPPEFLCSEWNFDSICTLCRAAGLLGNKFTFCDLLQCYEDAVGEVEGEAFKAEKILTNTWAVRLNKVTGMKVFCRFWWRLANRWDRSDSNTRTSLSFLLRNRIFPVISGKPQVMRSIRPAIYDASSIGLIRQHETSLEALFNRYADGKLKPVDLHMDKWDATKSNSRSPTEKQAKRRTVWAIDSVQKDLGMTEANWLEFAKDLNLMPNLIPSSTLRTIFRESGGDCWLTFCVLSLDVPPILGVGSPLSPLSFSDFCEALLRCGMFLNLAEIDNSFESRVGAGGADDVEAHLDVLFRCMDNQGCIFFKSKSRVVDSPVKRGVGDSPGVDDLESFLALVGTKIKEENEKGMGAPKGEIVLTVTEAIEASCRLGLGDLGLGAVLDAWMVMTSGRQYLLLGEAAILDYWRRWVQGIAVTALEEKLQDEVAYQGISCPTCGNVLDSEVWWKVGSAVEKVWGRLGEGEVQEVGASFRTVLVGGVAQMFISSLSEMGVAGEFVVHETCGLAVAALAGSSSVSRKVGEEKGGGEVDEEVTQQLKAVFDVYAIPTVDGEGEMIDEENYLQFLRDVKLLEEGGVGGEEGEEKIERVQAMELFRLNVSGESRDMGNGEEEEKVRLR
ncbi:hypothetical protein TrRE_jg12417 [Triparma retinervis]|uniref:Uncharacterized protein n=1 Tax=Triparma retinervis TaxID=2557542 RepID=A0A9W7DKJ2_9STRA|nr:hypothetical protein TrRE_jg12417 [Triparma retinervis]